MEIDHTCANPACDCKVKSTGDYCSEACRKEASGETLDHCTCGHIDCGTSTPGTHGNPDQNG